jgi:hypothetical protein
MKVSDLLLVPVLRYSYGKSMQSVHFIRLLMFNSNFRKIFGVRQMSAGERGMFLFSIDHKINGYGSVFGSIFFGTAGV